MAHLVPRQNFGPMGDMPAGPPPPGVIPNLVNPESIGERIYAVVGVFGILALISFCIRIFTRIRILRAFGKDDGMSRPWHAPIDAVETDLASSLQ